VSGSNLGSGWSANDPNNTTDLYANSPTSFGPYPVSGGDLNFVITDNATSTCSVNVSVTAPSTCSPVCANPPTANAGNDIRVCNMSPLTIPLTGSIGGDATSATWSGGGGVFDNAQNLNAVYTPTAGEINNGSVILTLTTDDPDGSGPCVAAMSSMEIHITQVDVNIQSQADYYGFDVPCAGDSVGTIQAFASGGTVPYDYEWNVGENKSTNSGLPAGEYRVTVTDAEGCIGSASITLREPGQLSPDIEPVNEGCDGSQGALMVREIEGGVAPYALYLDGSPFTILQNAPYTYSDLVENGTHEIIVSDLNGCEDTIGFTISEATGFEVDLGPDVFIRQGDEVTVDLNVGNTTVSDIVWSVDTIIDCHNCPEITISPLFTVRVRADVTDDQGCFGTDEKIVYVKQNPAVWVPNIFSPDGNGVNDLLQVFVTDQIESLDVFRVFDRLGNEFVEYKDIIPNGQALVNWDGVYRGKLVSPQVLVYYLHVTYKDGRQEKYSGDITLMR
ncbi:MAG TPA: hypothetical protein ENK85_03850, partial [Saprospiraceae bacterium]|nr:hypothetical protein [Saprospiraceae bacterium]